MDLKTAAKEKLDSVKERIIELSHKIHAHPEPGFQEVKASGWITEFLSDEGFHVETGICGLPTAFSAKAGSGPLHIAICAEYDALPEIGHACGHNIIAAAAVGAGIAAAHATDAAGMTVHVLGTPGEESGDAGGKILMLENGAFADIHAAMMIHPAPADNLIPSIIAASMFEVEYTGKEAHASAFPEEGINAADALVVAQTAIGLLRQHILPTQRIHGITTHGGDAPNVIPAHTSARYIVRGQTLSELEDLRPRVYKCFEAGALATGCKLDIKGGEKPYAEMIHNLEIIAIFKKNIEALGRTFPSEIPPNSRFSASTDMGNVSQVIPSIQPMIGIDSFPEVNHQPGFTEKCITESASRAVYDGALAMAWTAIDLATDPNLRSMLLSK